ncbi:eCIS core domain-containing protein [Massilia rhizosphaerae]|uniref:eCIS core domain-containing protein n=1 Tax=Massilia rhizosphaerae TaxID=2784389 RepID=UPI0018DE6F72|nr:DUF4157 domain-containing protein [Massilia rhizosphaerae]
MRTVTRLPAAQDKRDGAPAKAHAARAPDPAAHGARGAVQRQLADVASHSPRAAAQRRLADLVAHSPRVVAQRTQGESVDTAVRSANRTGLPDALKAGAERLGGMSLDHVRVHYNSHKPAQLNALAYAQGSDIHLAPGQERHLPHETWHVVQQAQGRVAPTLQARSGTPINDDAALETEADAMGARALRASDASQAAPARAPAVQRHQPIQRKWRETSLSKEHYQWDRLLAGVRWYANKANDTMYFIVESPNEENRHLIPLQGEVRSFNAWLDTGMFRVATGDNSVQPGTDHETTPADLVGKDFDLHIFRPVAHALAKPKPEDKYPRMEVKTAHYDRRTQDEFENDTGAALSKHGGRKPGEPNLAMQRDVNLGRMVYHLTTLKNLMFDPEKGHRKPGILYLGLDPAKGGGKGGACETCTVLNDVEMYEGSKAHSKGVVAVTTSRINIKMYANQRVEHGQSELAKGTMVPRDLLMRESILLRFALTAEHLAQMAIDPKHPKDDTVRLIRGIPIKPNMLEALTSDGWKPLLNLQAAVWEMFGDDVKERGTLFAKAQEIDALPPRDMHTEWGNLPPETREALREIVLDSPTVFPEFYGNIFHRQRREAGQGLAGYAQR